MVTLHRAADPPARRAMTDFAGRFLFAGLSAGRYELEVYGPMGEPRSTPVSTRITIDLDGDREVVVQAPP
jgi:hypothetical protein